MILSQVKKTIETYRMLSRGDRVIVGVSGGIDSVALLSVLHKLRPAYGISLVVAHLNHNLRGQESLRDAGFVKDLALGLDLPCEARSLDIVQFKRKGMTLQEAAREARFVVFRTLVQKHRAHKIALGQTADDQAETIVMRFLRGAGLGGLKGIPPIRDDLIIHPLIDVRREEIEAYAAEEGLSHIEDSSNRKDVYLRNRIRRHLIPLLEGYNPNLKTTLVRMGQILLQEDQYLRAKAQEVWSRVVRWEGDAMNLELTQLRDLHPALRFRVLRQCADAIGGSDAKRIGVTHISSLVNLTVGRKPHAMVQLPGRITARRIYDRLEIGKGERSSPPVFDHSVTFPGVTPIQEIGMKLVTEFLDQWNVRDCSSMRAYLDSQQLRLPLRVRNWRPGDRFRPLGMTGFKKITDCFIDWKVPLEERGRIPLILSGDLIVWVVGYRISQDVRVTAKTERVVHMEVQDL
jgi:tRNA(Ile)-lysidine synthase